jgi:hypothetical protein
MQEDDGRCRKEERKMKVHKGRQTKENDGGKERR